MLARVEVVKPRSPRKERAEKDDRHHLSDPTPVSLEILEGCTIEPSGEFLAMAIKSSAKLVEGNAKQLAKKMATSW